MKLFRIINWNDVGIFSSFIRVTTWWYNCKNWMYKYTNIYKFKTGKIWFMHTGILRVMLCYTAYYDVMFYTFLQEGDCRKAKCKSIFLCCFLSCMWINNCINKINFKSFQIQIKTIKRLQRIKNYNSCWALRMFSSSD